MDKLYIEWNSGAKAMGLQIVKASCTTLSDAVAKLRPLAGGTTDEEISWTSRFKGSDFTALLMWAPGELAKMCTKDFKAAHTEMNKVGRKCLDR